tara:strand:+ start:1442 stop:1735 length:294 start_codon:yes stop_codon:yes gene_type:complete
MDILTHSNGISMSSELKGFINKKVCKLENYIDKLTSADVYLKMENHSQVKDKTVEIKLNVPGVTLFSSETSKTFESATDDAVSSLVRQIKKHKDKKK